MKARIAAILSVALGAPALVGEQQVEFTAWMKANDAAVKALHKLEPKTGGDALRAAEMLGAVYENMIGFWRQRNAADAVKWSEQGKAAAALLASAAYAGQGEKAAAALKTIESTCNSCHEAYRVERPGGGYAMRPVIDPTGRSRRKKQ